MVQIHTTSICISIHAPARGATANRMTESAITVVFQSTLLREERHHVINQKKLRRTFQSTLLREERRFSSSFVVLAPIISIHAPARGATSFPIYLVPFIYISIHAPARGATDKIRCRLSFLFISIHAPARGATSKRTTIKGISIYFNPRSCERSDNN